MQHMYYYIILQLNTLNYLLASLLVIEVWDLDADVLEFLASDSVWYM